MNVQKVSIVIPVYNVEKYLRECVDSVISQDIGFERTIELILVNDGSKDGSEAICVEYAKKYPTNVVYIKQKNAGASEARNVGIDRASGDIIGFIDADDYVTREVIGAAVKYFRSAPKDVDIAISRVVQFGSKNRERPINKKFYFGTRTADLSEPGWYDVNPRVAPAFIRASVAKQHRFHRDIRFYEDTRYVSEVVSRTMKMGILAKGIYYNRMHDAEDTEASITTGATSERRFYMDSPEKVSLYLLQKFKGDNDYPPLYFQYVVMYEMRWRMFYNQSSPTDVLTKKDLETYNDINRQILDLLSDEAIVQNKLYNVRQRAYLLSRKNQKDILKEAEFAEDNRLFWNGLIIFNHMTKMTAKITGVKVVNDQLELRGTFFGFIVDGIEVFPRIDGKDAPANIQLINDGATMGLNDEYDEDRYKQSSFVVTVPLGDQKVHGVEFWFSIKGERYKLRYIDAYPLFENMPKLPRVSSVNNYLVAWYGDGLKVAPRDKHLATASLKIGSTVTYMIKYGRKGLGKIKRLCIRTIKMLK